MGWITYFTPGLVSPPASDFLTLAKGWKLSVNTCVRLTSQRGEPASDSGMRLLSASRVCLHILLKITGSEIVNAGMIIGAGDGGEVSSTLETLLVDGVAL